MILLAIIALLVGGFIFFAVIIGIIVYFSLITHDQKPLDADVEFCRKIMEEGRGYLFVCKRAKDSGFCARYPCKRLKEEKEREFQL